MTEEATIIEVIITSTVNVVVTGIATSGVARTAASPCSETVADERASKLHLK